MKRLRAVAVVVLLAAAVSLSAALGAGRLVGVNVVLNSPVTSDLLAQRRIR